MTVTVLNGQTLADIAIQEYGSLEAVFLLAAENDISPTAILQPGMELQRPDIVVNQEMETYCKNNGVSPATDINTEREIRMKIFTEQFTKQFQ